MPAYYVAGHALIVNDLGEILLTKRSAHDTYMPEKWDLPGGTAEGGETIDDATRREVKEETGLDVALQFPIFTFTNLAQPNRETCVIVYLAHYQGGDIVLDENEHSEYRWVAPDALPEFNVIPFLTAFQKESAWLKANT